jgi:hypothetical protein
VSGTSHGEDVGVFVVGGGNSGDVLGRFGSFVGVCCVWWGVHQTTQKCLETADGGMKLANYISGKDVTVLQIIVTSP